MRPKVTLITPVYNAMPYLRDYLASVMAQTWRPLQFIAADDGSTDGSLEYLRQFMPELEQAGIETLLLELPHGGQAAAVDAALPLAEGGFFTWCDADDTLTPDSVEKKALYLMEHPALGMVRSDGMVYWEEAGKSAPAAKDGDRAAQDIFDKLFHTGTYCYAGCYMMRTALLFDCYPDRHIPVSPEGQNLQLLLPPASRTACGFIPDVLFSYYIRGSGHSSRRRSYTEQLARVEELFRLRAELLSYCDCDREHYLCENEKIRMAARKELISSTLAFARERLNR